MGVPGGHLGTCSVIAALHAKCAAAVVASTSTENEAVLGESYTFVSDIEAWRDALGGAEESALLETAGAEYVIAMMNVCQAQYRNAFKGLRLVLELCMQTTHLSANLLLRGEWLKGEKDTVWASILNEDDGPLSKRFCRVFYPELADHVAHFRELTRTLYRELSECIHGNVPNHIPLPTELSFDPGTFNLWHEKAKLVRLVVHFALATRYFKALDSASRGGVEGVVLDQLGHIEAIRLECEREHAR